MIRRPLIMAAIAAGALLALAAPVGAHVSVHADDAAKGGFAEISFRVPNEEADADTTTLEVQLPPDHPIGFVSIQPKAGWTYQVETSQLAQPIETDDGEITEAVSQITWTGGAIKPGEFDEFVISAGPLPDDTSSLEFKAVQTYSDGTVVRWIDEATAGGAEAEHPAPVLALTDAAAGEAGGHTEGEGVATTNVGDDDDDSSDTLAIVAVIVAGLALIAAIAALGLRSRPADPGPGGDSGTPPDAAPHAAPDAAH